jgi:hypothetical protein
MSFFADILKRFLFTKICVDELGRPRFFGAFVRPNSEMAISPPFDAVRTIMRVGFVEVIFEVSELSEQQIICYENVEHIPVVNIFKVHHHRRFHETSLNVIDVSDSFENVTHVINE